MADLYLDNDVSLVLARLLRQNGHNVIATKEERRSRASDDEQLLTAATRQRILVTHNVADFVLLHNAWRRWAEAWQLPSAPPHSGIVVLEQGSADGLLPILHSFIAPGVSLANELLRWRRNSGWWRWNLTNRLWVQHP